MGRQSLGADIPAGHTLLSADQARHSFPGGRRGTSLSHRAHADTAASCGRSGFSKGGRPGAVH